MRILITNLAMAYHSGSETVAALLAEGLRRAGHEAFLFAPTLGKQAEELRWRGLSVVDRIDAVPDAPDVIHAQHVTPALIAMIRYPETPVVFNCHSPHFTIEAPLAHPQIRKVVAVDDSCARKCREQGVAEDDLTVVLNAVDLDRFPRRAPLPGKPGRALLLTKTSGQRAAIRAACEEAGIAVDEFGPASGRVVTDLGQRFQDYDIVFATARMALEAAAAGCAVVVCDDRGFAGLLTSARLDEWRRLNFGLGLLRQPTSVENLRQAIAAYDPADAASVCDRLRDDAGADAYAARYLEIYRQAIASPAPDREAVIRANARWAEELAVTATQRSWRVIANELALGGPELPGPPTTASLERLEQKIADTQGDVSARIDAMAQSIDRIEQHVGGGLLASIRRRLRAKHSR